MTAIEITNDRSEAIQILEAVVNCRLGTMRDAKEALGCSDSGHNLAVEAYIWAGSAIARAMGTYHPRWGGPATALKHFHTCLLEAAAILRDGWNLGEAVERYPVTLTQDYVVFSNEHQKREMRKFRSAPNHSAQRRLELGR